MAKKKLETDETTKVIMSSLKISRTSVTKDIRDSYKQWKHACAYGYKGDFARFFNGGMNDDVL